MKIDRSNNTYIRQSRTQAYTEEMRQRRKLLTNTRHNTSKGNNNYQPIAPNVNAPDFIKHTLKDLKAHIDSNTVVVGDFNIPLSLIDVSSKQKIKKS
jgi:hypothetical protein